MRIVQFCISGFACVVLIIVDSKNRWCKYTERGKSSSKSNEPSRCSSKLWFSVSPIWPITDRQRHQFVPEARCLHIMQTQLSSIASRSNIQGSNWLFPTSQIQYEDTLSPFIVCLYLHQSHTVCESYIPSFQGRLYREPGFSVDCTYSKRRPGTHPIYQSFFHNSIESPKKKKKKL